MQRIVRAQVGLHLGDPHRDRAVAASCVRHGAEQQRRHVPGVRRQQLRRHGGRSVPAPCQRGRAGSHAPTLTNDRPVRPRRPRPCPISASSWSGEAGRMGSWTSGSATGQSTPGTPVSTGSSTPLSGPPASTAGPRAPPGRPKRRTSPSTKPPPPRTTPATGPASAACPRPCPGTPAWNMRSDIAGRAMRLINDGVINRDGVEGLAARLGYSSRQLNRILSHELGAGPLSLARASRAQTARTLLVSTAMKARRHRLRRGIQQRAPVQRDHRRGLRHDALGAAGHRPAPPRRRRPRTRRP